MNRRNLLQSAGAVTILFVAGQAWSAFAQSDAEIPDGSAYEPWRTWDHDSKQGPLALVRAAILAANCYNSQPWLFRVSNKRIEIFADTKRNLGAFDPYLREMHFSLGCALENLVCAADAQGDALRVTLAPGQLQPPDPAGKPLLAITADLTGKKPLSDRTFYNALPHRHTNRNAFDPQKPVPTSLVRTVSSDEPTEPEVKVFAFIGKDNIARIADTVADATQELGTDSAVRAGTRPWTRTTLEEQLAKRDGSYVDPRAQKSANPDAYRELMKTGTMFGIIAVRDRYSRPQTIQAGQRWQRLHLLATSLGIAMRPANGSVELIDHQRATGRPARSAEALARFTGDASWQPTFMFYMGYATKAAPASPRRGIDQVQVT